MNKVFLKKIHIKNLGPIIEDEISFEPYTYFIGRNNAGKSHYLRAIEILLSSKDPDRDSIAKLQHDKSQPIEITGYFEGVQDFTSSLEKSKHREAIEGQIRNDILAVVRILNPLSNENTFGVIKEDGTAYNPTGFKNNLLKVLPEVISIFATDDTIDELKNRANTALSKLKKEVLKSFFESLSNKTKEAFVLLDSFLHSQSAEHRSSDLVKFEQHLQEELMGEFTEVVPSVEFDLPDAKIIGDGMKVFLNDGHRSEVEQKGHGLQRTTLLAMLRVLAKHGLRYQDKPTPIFLIGEMETFLHPYAQKLLADALDSLTDRYQVVTSTHSPFIISPKSIIGYRRVTKNHPEGARNIALTNPQDIDIEHIKRHLERRGNLEGLFADRVILIEGKHDEGFYEKIRSIFKIPFPSNKFTVFIPTGGKTELRMTRKFYRQMGFDDVSIICDADYLFSNDVKYLFLELGLNEQLIDDFRNHIGWREGRDPSLEIVIDGLNKKDEPQNFDTAISKLSTHRIFVLRKGSPEVYCKKSLGKKKSWEDIKSEGDLLDPRYLRELMSQILGQK